MNARIIRRARIAVFGLAALAITGCGFHLRGIDSGISLADVFPEMRVDMPGRGVNAPLLVQVRTALTQAGIKVGDAADAPRLTLIEERIDDQVASVRATTGKASEYTLVYTVRYALEGARVLGPESVRLQRDYSFDPARVVAKEYEQRELLNHMRREAASHITRRLARATAAP